MQGPKTKNIHRWAEMVFSVDELEGKLFPRIGVDIMYHAKCHLVPTFKQRRQNAEQQIFLTKDVIHLFNSRSFHLCKRLVGTFALAWHCQNAALIDQSVNPLITLKHFQFAQTGKLTGGR